MKFKFFKSVAALLSLGILMTGCTSDELMPDNEMPVEKDSKFYVNVTIANPAEKSTRAGDNLSVEDYDAGSKEEQDIHKVLFVFYNTSNKYVGSTVVDFNETKKQFEVDGEKIEGSQGTVTSDGSLSTLLNVVVPVSVNAGSLKPAYVIAVVNPTTNGADEQRSFEQFIGLTRILEQMTPQNGNGSILAHKGFTMSNSVYYDEQGDTKPVVAIPIPEDCLFTTTDEAVKTENKITIYVERVVAKVNVSYGKNESNTAYTESTLPQTDNTITDAEGNKYTLTFKPLAWGMSNVEKGTFIIKNFRGSTSGNCEGDDFNNYFPLSNMTYTTASSSYTDLKNPSWNFPSTESVEGTHWGDSGHRSFWAVSPTYFNGGKYPKYSDEVKDKGEGAYSLTYYSFDEIYKSGENKIGTRGATIGSSLYTLEHTSLEEVVTREQKRGVSCAIIVGQYSLLKNGAVYSSVGTFYIRNGVNSSGENVNIIYPDDETLMRYVLSANNKIYIVNPNYDAKETDPTSPKYGEYIPVPVNEEHLANFEIKHPSIGVTDTYIPNRYVSLHLKSNKVATANYYLRDASGVYKLITTGAQGNINDANKALYGLINGIEKYVSGYAFFAVPVEHLWINNNKDKDGNVQRIGDNGFTATLGQYGVVRNHIYSIVVSGIEGIGTGIGDTTVPIIPNVEQEKYFVKTELYVQRWRIVPAQNVVLRP